MKTAIKQNWLLSLLGFIQPHGTDEETPKYDKRKIWEKNERYHTVNFLNFDRVKLLSFRFILVANDHPTQWRCSCLDYFWILFLDGPQHNFKRGQIWTHNGDTLESIQLNPLNRTEKNTSFKLHHSPKYLKIESTVWELQVTRWEIKYISLLLIKCNTQVSLSLARERPQSLARNIIN